VNYYIQDDVEAALLGSQLPTIVALTKGCKSAIVVRNLSDIPAGCGAAVVTPTVAVHVLVKVSLRDMDIWSDEVKGERQGLVNLEAEISKCDKKLDLARLNLAKVIKVESQPDYLVTVPEDVRASNEEKVCEILMVPARS